MDKSFATELADTTEAVIHGRRTVLPKRLVAPGPDAAQLQRLLAAASAAPDHGELVPWRFVIVPPSQRPALARVFAQALKARDAAATEDQLAQAREKAFRAPVLMLAVADTGDAHAEVPATERLVSAGCAIQNVLLMATALGFGSALTSGRALTSAHLRHLFSLGAGDEALCFVSIGTISAGRRRSCPRPPVQRYVRELEGCPSEAAPELAAAQAS